MEQHQLKRLKRGLPMQKIMMMNFCLVTRSQNWTCRASSTLKARGKSPVQRRRLQAGQEVGGSGTDLAPTRLSVTSLDRSLCVPRSRMKVHSFACIVHMHVQWIQRR